MSPDQPSPRFDEPRTRPEADAVIDALVQAAARAIARDDDPRLLREDADVRAAANALILAFPPALDASGPAGSPSGDQTPPTAAEMLAALRAMPASLLFDPGAVDPTTGTPSATAWRLVGSPYMQGTSADPEFLLMMHTVFGRANAALPDGARRRPGDPMAGPPDEPLVRARWVAYQAAERALADAQAAAETARTAYHDAVRDVTPPADPDVRPLFPRGR